MNQSNTPAKQLTNVRNQVILNSTKFNPIETTINDQSKALFYKSALCRFKHIRTLGRTTSFACCSIAKTILGKRLSHWFTKHISKTNIIHTYRQPPEIDPRSLSCYTHKCKFDHVPGRHREISTLNACCAKMINQNIMLFIKYTRVVFQKKPRTNVSVKVTDYSN